VRWTSTTFATPITNYSRRPPISQDVSPAEGEVFRKKVLDYLADGVAVEEIIDLWSAVFPEAWNVYFDEESGKIHYLIEPEAMRQAD
jgi:hypothetical protein